MKVLLTGAAGELGREAGGWLVERGMQVVGVDVMYRAGLAFPLHVRNLLDSSAIYDLLPGVDAMVHLANHPHDGMRRPGQLLLAENVAMTAYTLTAAVEVGVRRIVYASSIQTVRGPRPFSDSDKSSSLPYLPMDGDLPAMAWSPYGLSKTMGEEHLRMLCRVHGDLSAAAVRFPWLAKRPADQRTPLPQPGQADVPHRLTWSPLDECFLWLWMKDAAVLIEALLTKPQPGMATLLPASAVPWVDADADALASRCFAGVPHKRSLAGLSAMVDLSGLERDYGWAPSDAWSVAWRERALVGG